MAVVGPLEVERVAHGGHAVARHEGRVVFVRGALPGERVMVRITDDTREAFWRGEVTEVLVASDDRVVPPCPVAGECGGCDLQHVSQAGQLRWKTDVLAEQLLRLAGIEWSGTVESAGDLLGWRTRLDLRHSGTRLGLLAHRSHHLVDLPAQGCLIADPALRDRHLLDDLAARAEGDELRLAVGESGVSAVSDGRVIHGPALVEHTVLGHRFRVHPAGFWQVHPRAAELLTEVVLDGLDPRAGETALDLYCGVGLFAGALSDRGVRVTGVEINKHAVAQARRNVPDARFIAAPLDRALGRLPDHVDLVVLDPARQGAGRKVVGHVAGLGARAIVHVGCDPASFARDLALFAEQGWKPEWIRGFDLFGMTQHLEAVASLRPTEH
ncbi:class I SAM-dependent RNA methyltransferase [Aestuariimicrobium sp. T2.26MG-19.2B]|uniref:class I SAM-dependent RNA methyltransferase n=1 Tax=Aestuariimicrobium sp. T2.26MG-19.2B TaxID=3040679 RepID=UPI00247747A8|nr:TRAM domain-containing protein [Aestuariimicrobium sp. T2.26MG-19.2B]CAI9408780.1 23S rRNA (uracil-C(5))-methyltransferase RlmCD [Aestuariimicrobium sp. T2.26MG-19.2B]